MPDLRPDLPDRPISLDEASVLRHDMITPINIIIGYCELLVDDEWMKAEEALVAAIHPIRQHGMTLLRSIDQVLLVDSPRRSDADLRRLGSELSEPGASVVASCDQIAADWGGREIPEQVVEDLALIRSAGARMIVMAGRLEAGLSPTTDGMMPLAEE